MPVSNPIQRGCGALLLALLALACAADRGRTAYKLYPGPRRPAAELATLEFGPASTLVVDGLEARVTEWTCVEVQPGPHAIVWLIELELEHARVDESDPRRCPRFDLRLEAGHRYSVHAETGLGYVARSWIRDDDTGEVVGPAPPRSTDE